jgi:hypothetical protein
MNVASITAIAMIQTVASVLGAAISAGCERPATALAALIRVYPTNESRYCDATSLRFDLVISTTR